MNAESSDILGFELNNSLTIANIWTVNLNYNLYNSIINADAALNTAKNQRWSWFGKWNNTLKLPTSLTFQLSVQYYSKTVLPSSGSSAAQQSVGPGGSTGSSQSYIDSHYDFDAALKKDWKWGEGNTLSLSASINDTFGTDKRRNYSVTPYMDQNNYRFRQPRIVRFTLSYRFGKFDKNIFKNDQQ